jgi:DNA-binding transcriptional LysR family regulator
MFGMVSMLVAHLEGVDLNLLPPLAALLEERHVTRAAERSGLSQPAMSRALGRLRLLLDDQLLVRDGSVYVLTPRAERIQRQLAGVMPQLETLFAAEVFDPATAEEHYRVAATDYPLLLFLHQVAREVNKISPHSTLRIESPPDSVFHDVAHGRLDLSFYVADPPGALRQELLFDDVCVCVMSTEHPHAKRKRLTLDEYVRCSHLVIDIIDGEQPLIADRLRELGVARRATVTLPLNLAALAALPGTNLVATLNKRLVDRYAQDLALAVVAAPVEIEPFHYFMVWHPRLDHDPAQQWLRDTIRSVAAATVVGPSGRRQSTRPDQDPSLSTRRFVDSGAH